MGWPVFYPNPKYTNLYFIRIQNTSIRILFEAVYIRSVFNLSVWTDRSSFIDTNVLGHEMARSLLVYMPYLDYGYVELTDLGHPQCTRQFADLKGATSARDPFFCLLQSIILPTHDTQKMKLSN